MEVTTLSYENLHKHGELFANMFRARHKAFIQRHMRTRQGSRHGSGGNAGQGRGQGTRQGQARKSPFQKAFERVMEGKERERGEDDSE